MMPRLSVSHSSLVVQGQPMGGVKAAPSASCHATGTMISLLRVQVSKEHIFAQHLDRMFHDTQGQFLAHSLYAQLVRLA